MEAILFVLTVVFVGLVYFAFSEDSEGCGISAFLVGLVLFFATIAIPISYYDTKCFNEEYQAVKITIESGRKLNNFEIAALTQKTLDINRELASLKYWNNTIFDIYIADTTAILPYID